MGSPCIYGLKMGEELKVTCNYYGKNIIDSFVGGTLFQMCQFIRNKKVNKERLVSMFNAVVLEQDEDKLSDVPDSMKNKSFIPSIEQKYLEELFYESNLGFMFPDGTYHIVDFSMETYNQYYIDIDKESVVINSNSMHFEIPISLIQEKDEKWLRETIKAISKAFSYSLGIDIENIHNFFLLKRYASGKVTQKGQVTIPIEVREVLKIKEGDRLEFIFDWDLDLKEDSQGEEKGLLERMTGEGLKIIKMKN